MIKEDKEMKLNKFEETVVKAIMEELDWDVTAGEVIPYVKFAKAINPDKIKEDHVLEMVRQVVIKKSSFNPLA